MTRCRFVVRGRVQRVGFRQFTVEQARALGLGGFVANTADGTVVGEVEGDAVAVAEFLARVRRGPRFAAVTAVEVEDVPGDGTAHGGAARSFEIR